MSDDYPILAEHGRWRVLRGHYHDLLQFVGPEGDVLDVGDLDTNLYATLDAVAEDFSAARRAEARLLVAAWFAVPKREAAAC